MNWKSAELSEFLSVDADLIKEAITDKAWAVEKNGQFDSRVGIAGFVAWLVARGNQASGSIKQMQEKLMMARLEKTQEEKMRLSAERLEREARTSFSKGMFSENQLSEMTGLDRRTIKKRLQGINPEISGSAHLYDLKHAVKALVSRRDESGSGMTLEKARIEESQSKTKINEIMIENMQKDRMPVATVIALMESISSEIINIHRGIPDDAATRLSEELRDIPNRLKW